jgi:hypothetical protein
MKSGHSWSTYVRVAAVAVLLVVPISIGAQQRGGRGAQPPQTGKAAAPIDLIGYWVSIVTEDWIYRMTTPKKGDMGSGVNGEQGFAPLPTNPEGRRVALAWDPAKDEAEGNQCKSYGAGNFLNVPGRLHITWADDNTLQVELDNGMQTRQFHFGGAMPANSQPSWQGYSTAEWIGNLDSFERLHLAGAEGRSADLVKQVFGEGGGSRNGNLKVLTSGLKAGYLRKNGFPYSDKAKLEEHFRVFTEPNGDIWLITTALIEDPTYLQEPFIVSRNFKKEANGSKWSPEPCTAR